MPRGMRGSHIPCPSAGIGLHVGSHPRPGTEPVRDSASGSREHALPLGGARSAHWCTKAQLGITSPSWDGASSDSSFGIPAAPWSPHLECATGTLGPGTGTLRGLRASRPAGAGFPHDGERLRGVAEEAQCPSGAGVQNAADQRASTASSANLRCAQHDANIRPGTDDRSTSTSLRAPESSVVIALSRIAQVAPRSAAR